MYNIGNCGYMGWYKRLLQKPLGLQRTFVDKSKII